MPQDLSWENINELGVLLSEKHPELAPLSVDLPEVQRFVSELAEFKGDVTKADQKTLKAVRGAWQEEYQDRTQD